LRGLRLPLPLIHNGVVMIKWKRPSGLIIETNETDETIEHAVKSGWEQVKLEGNKTIKLKKNKNAKAELTES
jgi:hypothetical protein